MASDTMESTPDPIEQRTALTPLIQDVDMVDANSEYSHTSGTSLQAAISPLLSLPPELRVKIWSYALQNDNNDSITWPAGRKVPRRVSTGLLRTCHTIYQEAIYKLYEDNIVLFRHPSDANMFLYAHNPQLGRRAKCMLNHILDRDLSLWMGYYSSNNTHRSLKHDYPNLKQLFIVLRSTPALAQTGPDIVAAYRRWHTSLSVTNLCGSLKDLTQAGLVVRVIFTRLVNPLEMTRLMELFPEELVLHPDDARGPRLRTKWVSNNGALVALDGTDANNPWRTGNTF